MVDPTTVNKFLAQPTRGSDVGTWDVPVNGNMGIIDNSFGGVATIPLTNSPVTLSGAQYQCAFLVFTGALSGSVAVTFPAVGSFYTVQNLTTNTSNFQVTFLTTAGGQTIGCPWGTPTQIFTDGSNVKYMNLGRGVGDYWDYAGSSVPAWVSACTVPPYLNCDGTAFSSATYPVLATILGGTTLPDARGRLRLALDAGVGRVSSAVSGVPGNTLLGSGGDQNTQAHSHTANSSVTDPGHLHTLNISNSAGANAGFAANPNAAIAKSTTDLATTGITVATSIATYGSGGAQNMPPVFVGGITMIRSA